MRRALSLVVLFFLAAGARAEKWVLAGSTLTYRVVHRLHRVEGTSHAARGKGVCEAGCRFLVAAPVNTFDSGDSNRDLHMIETTRGAQFPMVKVSVSLPQAPSQDDFTADLAVEFAGRSHTYAAVPFHATVRTAEGLGFTGRVPLRISDFEVPAPSLLGMAIKDDVPVDVEMAWRRE